MIEAGAFKGLFSGLKAASDLAKGAIEIRDQMKWGETIIKLQNAIITAQNSAIDAQNEQTTLLQTISDQKAELARAEAWDAEKQRYKLEELVPGTFAYALKPEAAGPEPAHHLCANCYEQRRKSILQSGVAPDRRRHYRCPSCKTEFRAFL